MLVAAENRNKPTGKKFWNAVLIARVWMKQMAQIGQIFPNVYGTIIASIITFSL